MSSLDEITENLNNKYKRKFGLFQIKTVLQVKIGYCENKGLYMREHFFETPLRGKSEDEIFEEIKEVKKRLDSQCKKDETCFCHKLYKN